MREQSPEQRSTRMAALHAQVMTHDVHHWARTFLDHLALAGRANTEVEEFSLDWQMPTTGPFSPGESPIAATGR